jgi:hypothetical protein
MSGLARANASSNRLPWSGTTSRTTCSRIMTNSGALPPGPHPFGLFTTGGRGTTTHRAFATNERRHSREDGIVGNR